MRPAVVFTPIAFILLASSSRAAPAAPALGPRPDQIKNFVTFGDSYTDATIDVNGSTPWPVYVAGYANLNLFPFAHAGATCNQTLTPRQYPAVMQDELPEYFAQVNNGSIKVKGDDTIYSLWIGTNDLGPNTLLTGGVIHNTTIVDTTMCAIHWIQTLYKSGARNFIYQNIVPLERVPLYAVNSYPNHYWTAPRNTTEWHLFINELVAAGNEIAELLLQSLPASLPGAHIALFDSHSLFNDILDHPSEYLNGTAPLNTTGSIISCQLQVNESASDAGDCTVASGTDKDSFVWLDELHPSEQTDRIVAHEFVNIIQGNGSKWATWFS